MRLWQNRRLFFFEINDCGNLRTIHAVPGDVGASSKNHHSIPNTYVRHVYFNSNTTLRFDPSGAHPEKSITDNQIAFHLKAMLVIMRRLLEKKAKGNDKGVQKERGLLKKKHKELKLSKPYSQKFEDGLELLLSG